MAPRPSFAVAVAAPVVALLALAIARPAPVRDLSNFVFDTYQRLAPRTWSPEAPVRIIDIDEESLRRFGQWPWPRTKLAELVTAASERGAAVIAFDIVFAEPDRLSLDAVVNALPAGAAKPAIAAAAQSVANNDAVFGASIQNRPVVLGAILTDTAPNTNPLNLKTGFAIAGDDPLPWLLKFNAAVQPLENLASAASGIASLNWFPGRDQVVRELPLLVRFQDQIVPSLTIETLRIAQGASTIIVKSSNASGETAFGRSTGVNAIKVGNIEIPTGPRSDRRVYFTKTEPKRFIPAWKLLSGDVATDDIKGRILIVGVSAAGLFDQRASPLDNVIPGVEVHAQAIEHILEGGSLIRPDWAPAVEWFAALALSLGVAAIAYRASPIAGALAGAVALPLIGLAGWYAFRRHGVLIDPLMPALTAAAAYLSGTVELFRHERSLKAQVTETFGRFVSPKVVERLAKNPAQVELGGETRTLTLLFCDLRDFTTLSEGMTSADVIGFMNAYLTPMTDAILARDGTIDKYMGDAIMAFWNAPLDNQNHARDACLTALDMQRALVTFNEKRNGQPISFGIGINTGECAVGNLGSIHRLDYSAIGDPVNVASRLEALTKTYAVTTLASEETRAAAPDLAWLEIGAVRVKGREQQTSLFALIGDRETAQSDAFKAWAAAHQHLQRLVKNHQFDAARDEARRLSKSHPGLAGHYAKIAAGELSSI